VSPLWIGGGGAGLAAGVFAGLFGLGGGLVLIPFLALALGLGQHEAQGVTLAVMLLPIGLPAVLAYHRSHPIRWRLVAALVAGFVASVPLGAQAANAIPDRPMRLFFAAFLAVAALRQWRDSSGGGAQERRRREASALHGLWIGGLAGLLSGLLGIGGGIVMVPLLTAVVGQGQHEAQGTSLATMLPPIGLPGVLVYARAQGGLPWGLMGVVALGFAAGGLLGARAAGRVDGRRLGRLFAVLVLVVAVGLAWDAARAR
jgi:uncharacterized membrane protein YfcA